MSCHIIVATAFGHGAIIFQKKPFLITKTVLPQKTIRNLVEFAGQNEWGQPYSHKKARIVSKAIIDYFAGNCKNPRPAWEWLDMGKLTNLQKAVLTATAEIPFGTLCTYRDIATAIDSPKACRFVGTTLANNPFPILIPCHRVIRSDLSIGGFAGGMELKKQLIRLESGS